MGGGVFVAVGWGEGVRVGGTVFTGFAVWLAVGTAVVEALEPGFDVALGVGVAAGVPVDAGDVVLRGFRGAGRRRLRRRGAAGDGGGGFVRGLRFEAFDDRGGDHVVVGLVFLDADVGVAGAGDAPQGDVGAAGRGRAVDGVVQRLFRGRPADDDGRDGVVAAGPAMVGAAGVVAGGVDGVRAAAAIAGVVGCRARR